MSDEESWVEVANFGLMFEAEMAATRLKNAGLPAMVKGESGLFGAGYAGGVPAGASVMVPASVLDDARALLEEE